MQRTLFSFYRFINQKRILKRDNSNYFLDTERQEVVIGKFYNHAQYIYVLSTHSRDLIIALLYL